MSAAATSRSLPPAPVRRAAWGALLVSLGHVVFGGIVRISGSGMGCGDNWPKCYGYWFPPFERMDLVIEVMHRYFAIALFVAIALLVAAAWRARAAAGVGGPGGVWRAALLGLGLWFAPALFGAVTVFTGNPPWATVVHKLLAAALLGVLVVATIRAGGMGTRTLIAERAAGRGGTRKAVGGATAAAVMALLVVVLGGLTAKLPDAAVACAGFPLCGEGSLGGGAQHVQLTHRVVAYLLVLHLASLPLLFGRRGEPAALRRVAWVGLALGVLQVAWAAWMVTGGFPPVVRSLHQATGVLIWVVAMALTYLARIAAGRTVLAAESGAAAAAPGVAPLGMAGARG
jgi:heme A synthase